MNSRLSPQEAAKELLRRRSIRRSLTEWARYKGFEPAPHHKLIIDELEELNLGGRYLEIVEPERLVFTHVWMDENGNPTSSESTCTVTLTARGNKTEMNFRQTGFDSEGSRDGHNEGWNECFDKLDEMLSAA